MSLWIQWYVSPGPTLMHHHAMCHPTYRCLFMRTASTAVTKFRSQIAAPVLVFHTRRRRGENAGCSTHTSELRYQIQGQRNAADGCTCSPAPTSATRLVQYSISAMPIPPICSWKHLPNGSQL
jgi:hypothetical protein